MAQLYRLTDDGQQLAEYRLGDQIERIPGDELDGCVKPLEGAEGDLGALRDELKDIRERYGKGEEFMEQDAAVAVHRHLDITRRHASHPGLWHWLAIVQFPKFVRHRWPWGDTDRSETSMREKFLGRGTDLYGNALHRLWWFAELTRDGDDYSRTEEMLGKDNQYIVERIFDRSFSRRDEAVKAAVDVLIDYNGDTAEDVAHTFRHRETNYHIESMSQSEIEQILDGILTEVGATP